METKAHYALVGAFALALVVATAVFAVWIGNVRFDQQYEEFDVVFDGPVRGLAVSSEVRFNGIKVGEVTRLGLDADPSRVIARIRVFEQTPVRADSVAQLEPQGITGLSYIQISAGSPDAPMLQSKPNQIPQIASRPAQFDLLFEGGQGLVEAAIKTLDQLRAVLSPENVEQFSKTLENVQELTTEMRERAELIDEARSAIARLEAAAVQIEAAGADVQRVMNDEVTPMVAETETASIEVARAAREAADMLEDLRGPVDRFANQGLDEATRAMVDLRRLVTTLDRIAAELESNPAAFVSGSGRKEVEVPR